jgi:RNA polymerase subunit RPABC4/transcription elongation factor Spt4
MFYLAEKCGKLRPREYPQIEKQRQEKSEHLLFMGLQQGVLRSPHNRHCLGQGVGCRVCESEGETEETHGHTVIIKSEFELTRRKVTVAKGKNNGCEKHKHVPHPRKPSPSAAQENGNC